ncbi:hypothetical protein GSY71_13575 [Pusillimonas sp. TS35]|nr:hypothetical protein [Pusillimonas sp. TS35]
MRQVELLFRRRFRGAGVIAAMVFLLCNSVTTAAHAANGGQPLLRCEISLMGDNPRKVEFTPTADPYTVESVDIDGIYRFKAVMVGARPIAYIKLYVYYHKSGRFILLHQAKYVPPPLPSPSDSVEPFTGIQYLYSPNLERELRYSCKLTEAYS